MAKGDGTIRQSRDKKGKPIPNTWEVCVYTGFNPVTKSYGRSYKTVYGTKADARRVRDEMRQSLDAGLRSDADKVKFAEFAAEWLERRKQDANLAAKTVQSNDYAIRVINGYLADVRLVDITPYTIDALYSAIKRDRGISGTTLNGMHRTLNQIMKQAVRYDLILRNPLERVDTPKCDPVNRRSLTQEEGRTLLALLAEEEKQAYTECDQKEARQEAHGNAEGRTYIRDISPIACTLAARFGLATGARRGEVLAMTWETLDTTKRLATIKASLSSNGLKSPKTKAGTRRISIDSQTADALAKWKTYQAKQLAKVGIRQTGLTPIFCDSKGSYINPENFSRWWRGFTERNGFKGLTFHELRHTQATQLLAQNQPLTKVQHRLGHSSAAITLAFYNHALPDADYELSDTIEQLFGQDTEQETTKQSMEKTA